ncbi:MAG: glycosyltransferase family 39 protein [Mesorhizobium sp.]|jgi:4-amino-4-deoxy-L-arabinose transferase-like glycosyltransferase
MRPNNQLGSQTPYWLFIASLVSVLVLRRVVAEGMFLDGVIYAVLSRNLSEGLGSIWAPHFSDTLFPIFSEHPPLAFWLQSFAFGVFGKSIFVEKLYSLTTFIIQIALIFALWNRLVSFHPSWRRFAWLPVLFWILVESVPWAYANNLLENTLTLFTTLAVYLIVVACEANRRVSRISLSIVAGLAICAATLTKGPTGFFPLVGFGCYWLAIGRIKFSTAVSLTIVMFLAITAFYAAILLAPEPRAMLLRYFDVQLLASFAGDRGSVGWYSKLKTFVDAVGVVAIVTAVILVAGRWTHTRQADDRTLRTASFLALVALSGSVPIFLSPRVTGLYLNPSIPFFALAFATITVPVIAHFDSLIGTKRKHFLAMTAVLLVVSLGYAINRWGTIGRDRELLTDLSTIASMQHLVSPADRWTTAPICPEDWQYWELHAYMARYYKTSLRAMNAATDNYVLASKNCASIDRLRFKNFTTENTMLDLYMAGK